MNNGGELFLLEGFWWWFFISEVESEEVRSHGGVMVETMKVEVLR